MFLAFDYNREKVSREGVFKDLSANAPTFKNVIDGGWDITPLDEGDSVYDHLLFLPLDRAEVPHEAWADIYYTLGLVFEGTSVSRDRDGGFGSQVESVAIRTTLGMNELNTFSFIGYEVKVKGVETPYCVKSYQSKFLYQVSLTLSNEMHNLGYTIKGRPLSEIFSTMEKKFAPDVFVLR
jgi:hypothetical protein